MQPIQQLAAITDGSSLKGWILAFAGNIFAAFLALRALGHFLKKEWGEMITLFVAAVFVAAIIWFPDGVKTVLTDVWGKVSGTA
ncbi:hypothetical protein ACFWA9_10010 [Kitasatospora sp. NPDC059973]|uniref:hypothetical protein n=1 Tax=Kitasatospora sp. NPDC059973 TaxID=3347020 RepID=UPI0036B3101D